MKSLECSVEPIYFDATLNYVVTSDSILPALGAHPLYIKNLLGYLSSLGCKSSLNGDNPEHIDVDTVDSELVLPMEELLLKHPNCLVGEIGLCKIAKWVRKATALKVLI